MGGNKHYIRTKSIDKMIDLGFKFNKLNSSNDCGIYVYRFPVYKYKDTVLLEAEITINDSNNKAFIEIKRAYLNEIYPIFSCPYGNNQIMKNILERKIKNKLRVLSIKEVIDEK